MPLEHNNIFKAVSESPEQEAIDKQCSDLMIIIHEKLDLKAAPIKNVVQTLGVTPSQARKLVKGDVANFTIFELQTFLKRI
jgi:predicted XRE-type DNA-binding protein